jgi:hypothetical protein
MSLPRHKWSPLRPPPQTSASPPALSTMPSLPPNVPPPPPPPPPPPMPPNGWCDPGCPQSRSEVTVLDEYWRSTTNKFAFVHESMGTRNYNRYLHRCDRYEGSPMAGHANLLNASWYMFTGEAGDEMPTSPPAFESCGTSAPGWLATSHPNPGDPPRYGLVCFRDDPHEPQACGEHVEVRVCACSYDAGVLTTYSYKLPQPPGCMEAFCGARHDR